MSFQEQLDITKRIIEELIKELIEKDLKKINKLVNNICKQLEAISKEPLPQKKEEKKYSPCKVVG